jgi:hypothetical protein
MPAPAAPGPSSSCHQRHASWPAAPQTKTAQPLPPPPESSSTATTTTLDQLSNILQLIEEQQQQDHDVILRTTTTTDTRKGRRRRRHRVAFSSSSPSLIGHVRNRRDLTPHEKEALWVKSTDYNWNAKTRRDYNTEEDAMLLSDIAIDKLGVETTQERSERKVRMVRAFQAVMKEQKRQRQIYQGSPGVVDTYSLSFRYSQLTQASKQLALERAERTLHDAQSDSLENSSSSFSGEGGDGFLYKEDTEPQTSRWDTHSTSQTSSSTKDPSTHHSLMPATRRRSSQMQPLSPALLADVLSVLEE